MTRVLIVRPDALGDVILTTPLIKSIKLSLPSAEIVTLVQPLAQDVYEGLPEVSEQLVLPRILSIKTWIESYFKLRKKQFDIVVFPYLDGYYATLMWMLRIPVRVGDARQLIPGLFLNRKVTLNFRNLFRHQVEFNNDLLHGLFKNPIISNDTSLPYEDIKLDDIDKETLWIGIHPTTGRGNRAWTPEKYAKLIDRIHTETSYRVVITGAGEKDNAVFERICELTTHKPLSLVNKLSVKQLKSAVRRCCVFVGTDTGPVHLAAAMGTPVLCVSPTKFVKSLRWGPWRTSNRVISNTRTCELVCDPFVCKETICLDAIHVDDAFKKLMRLLQSPQDFQLDSFRTEWVRTSVRIGVLGEIQVPYLASLELFTVQLPLRNLRQLVSKIKRYDLTVIHYVEGDLSKFKKWLIRLLVSPFMAVPPVFVSDACSFDSELDILRVYKEAFQYNGYF